MPERCTCGAVLPEDARFCHKCGKPQRDEPLLEQEVVETPLPPPPLPVIAPPRIGFHNGLAVRIALVAGLLTFVFAGIAGQLPFPALLSQAFGFGLLAASGFLAVYLYRRRTGQKLSVVSGAHLGWICGLFGFIVVLLLLAVMTVSFSDPTMVAALREQFRTRGLPDANVDQLIQIFHSPAEIVAALVISFVLFTALPAFGGAIGAKLLDRD